jgi:hypothetical protein
MLASHDRYPCTPFKYRPAFQWPDGKRLAVYLAVNVEHFPYGEPGGASTSTGRRCPGVSGAGCGATMATGSVGGNCSTCSRISGDPSA